MVNQKRGLTDSVSWPPMEILWRRITYWKSGAKDTHQLNPVGQATDKKLRP